MGTLFGPSIDFILLPLVYLFHYDSKAWCDFVFVSASWGPWLLNPTRGFPKIKGTFLGGPHNKDYSIFGSVLGSPLFGETTTEFSPPINSLCRTTLALDVSA